MKTVFRTVLALGVAALLFTACEKDVVSSDMQIDESKKGTVVLRVGADLDLELKGKTGINQPLPAGKAKAIFTAKMEGFGLPDGANPVVKVVDLAGEVTVELPATEKGVTWDVTFTDFTEVQRQATGDTTDPAMQNTPYTKQFKAGAINVANLKPNDYRVHVVTYSGNDTAHP